MPSDPNDPPPIREKVSSSGAIVLPPATRNAAPRQTSRPPSVTMKDGMPRKAISTPWKAPISVPIAMPKMTVMIQIDGWPMPRAGASHSTCNSPMYIPTIPMIEPTDRSMFRVMITRTIPVAMIPI